MLRGTLDDSNPLAALRGNALILSKIFDCVDEYYEEHIDRVSVAWKTVSNHAMFPEPTGIQINMMPIDLYCMARLPKFCQQYIPMIRGCGMSCSDVHHARPSAQARVGYLTISEEVVPVGSPHKRPGLHIERPGEMRYGGQIVNADTKDVLFMYLAWGLGCYGHDGQHGIPVDGIYMASNISDSCQIYPQLITRPAEVTDRYGGIEHVRKRLGPGRGLAANELVWFTDRTPHESLPIPAPNDADADAAKTVHRQFFRLVVGPISVWYSKHNTANPDGLQPDAPISHDDKFAAASRLGDLRRAMVWL